MQAVSVANLILCKSERTLLTKILQNCSIFCFLPAVRKEIENGIRTFVSCKKPEADIKFNSEVFWEKPHETNIKEP